MREIKFRIWSRHFNQWMNHCGAIDCCGRVVSLYVKKDGTQITPMWTQFPDDDITIQQFTGLKDKNGKEIYEGDVIQYNRRSSYDGINFEVKWNEDNWGWVLVSKNKDYLVNERTPEGNRYSFVEVVGNVFENPE